MGKSMLERLEATMEAKYAALFQLKMDMLEQILEDAALIAAHDVLGLGAGRAVAFLAEMQENTNEIARLTLEDAKQDKELWFSKAKLDEKIKAIVGEEHFAPWEVRYGKEKV